MGFKYTGSFLSSPTFNDKRLYELRFLLVWVENKEERKEMREKREENVVWLKKYGRAKIGRTL